jgi:hypothetical protein
LSLLMSIVLSPGFGCDRLGTSKASASTAGIGN